MGAVWEPTSRNGLPAAPSERPSDVQPLFATHAGKGSSLRCARPITVGTTIAMPKQAGKWQAEITDAGRIYLEHGHHRTGRNRRRASSGRRVPSNGHGLPLLRRSKTQLRPRRSRRRNAPPSPRRRRRRKCRGEEHPALNVSRTSEGDLAEAPRLPVRAPEARCAAARPPATRSHGPATDMTLNTSDLARPPSLIAESSDVLTYFQSGVPTWGVVRGVPRPQSTVQYPIRFDHAPAARAPQPRPTVSYPIRW